MAVVVTCSPSVADSFPAQGECSSSPTDGSSGDAISRLTPAEAKAEDERLRQTIVESMGAAAASATGVAGASRACGAAVEVSSARGVR